MPTKADAEKSLSDLAMTELGDKLPALIPYLLGFELITTNDEKTRAAGVLGFKVGEQRLTMPVLFLNGRVRGMEIINLGDTDTFVSATPPWIDFLTSRSSIMVGEGDSGGQTAGTVPSAALRIFNQPPRITKVAAIEAYENFIDEAKALAENTEFNFPAMLKKAGRDAYMNFMTDLSENHFDLFTKVAEFYGLDKLTVDFSDEPAKPLTKKASAPERKLAFVTRDLVEKDPSAFSQETKIEVMSKGLSIMDKRAAAEKSELFTDDYGKTFSAPTQSGFYSMINVFGKLIEPLIIHSPFVPGKPNSHVAENLIVDTKSKIVYKPRVGANVLARLNSKGDEEEFKTFVEKLSTIDSSPVKIGNTYVMVSDKREFSIPFTIKNRVVEEGVTTLSIDYDYCYQHSLDSHGMNPGWGINEPQPCCEPAGSGKYLRLVEMEGQKMRRIGNIMAVSTDWKVMEVKESPSYSDFKDSDKYREASDEYKKDIDALAPASPAGIAEAVSARGLIEIKVHKKSAEYIIREGGKRNARVSRLLTKNAALRTLVGVIGLDSTEAASLLGSVKASEPTTFWVKKADIYNGMPFPDTDENMGINDLGVQEQYPFSNQTTVPMNNPQFPEEDFVGAGNYDKIRKSDADFLMRAADSSSRNVIDPAMIGILLKTNRTQLQIDGWIPDLVSALDKLCRLVLLFYWKNADFAKSYGSEEMAELEDVLLNNIKNLGTVVLFFKQRTAEGSGTKIDAFAS